LIIKSSENLCKDYEAFSKLAHKSAEPIFITKEGEGDLVLMSIELYEKQFAQVPKAGGAKKRTTEGEKEMTELLLGNVLKQLYETAPRGLQVASIHTFSIYYADTIEKERLNKKEILRSAGLQESYQTEISKGINLARYVSVKEEFAQYILEIQRSFE